MTEVVVRIPTALRSLTGGTSEITVQGENVGDALQRLTDQHPKLRRHLFTPDGKLRNFVTVYRNEEDVRYLERDATPLRPGDLVSIVPAIAGGRDAPAERPASSLIAVGALATGATERLSNDELVRYSRHLLLSEVGVEGQKRLRASKVLIVGTGGLGSPTALYLAAAGVGEIGLVDFDRVDLSNLQRQVLYATPDVGRPKIEVAAERLTQMNPHVKVVEHPQPLRAENAIEIIRPYDVVVDGTDNFPTRYLVNDACTLLGKPNVYGSIYRFEGQASVFDARHGPCYRCLYPEPPPPGLVPSCAEAGVLGVLPGLVGLIQATETVKLLLGAGEPLVGRLLLYDALAMSFRELKLRKNPECVLCGTHPTQTGLIDYPAFCGVPAPGESATDPGLPKVTVEELASEIASPEPPFLLDVREPAEWAIVHLPGAHLIPRLELPDRLGEITQAGRVVVYCKTGQRSAQATKLLVDLGFRNVRNLTGGIEAYSRRVDPSLPRY